MRTLLIRAAVCFVLGFALAAVAFTEDEKKAGPVAIGAAVPDFTATDTDGKTFQLTKRALDKKQVEAAVRKAAEARGATKGCPLTTTFASLKQLLDDDELDTILKQELIADASTPFGRVATEDNTEALKTLGDTVNWIMKVDQAPLVIMCWSPRCPTSRKLNSDILEQLGTVDARVYALACNYKDTDADYAKFREIMEFKFRILLDREQKVTDVLGGKRTPHFFVLDKANKLRFRGSLDNTYLGADVEEYWLTDAIKAVAAGKEVPKAETSGPG